jgi:hypothetical protein
MALPNLDPSLKAHVNAPTRDDTGWEMDANHRRLFGGGIGLLDDCG